MMLCISDPPDRCTHETADLARVLDDNLTRRVKF